MSKSSRGSDSKEIPFNMPSLSLLGLGLRRSRSRDAEDMLNLITERAKRAKVETEYHAARLLYENMMIRRAIDILRDEIDLGSIFEENNEKVNSQDREEALCKVGCEKSVVTSETFQVERCENLSLNKGTSFKDLCK